MKRCCRWILAVVIVAVVLMGCGGYKNNAQKASHNHAKSSTVTQATSSASIHNQQKEVSYAISPTQMLTGILDKRWLKFVEEIYPVYITISATGRDITSICLDTSLSPNDVKAKAERLAPTASISQSGMLTTRVCKWVDKDMVSVISGLKGGEEVLASQKLALATQRYMDNYLQHVSREFVVDMSAGKIAYIVKFNSADKEKRTEDAMRKMLVDVVKHAFGEKIGQNMIFKDTNIDGSTDLYLTGSYGSIQYIFASEDENGDGIYDVVAIYVRRK